MCVRGGEGRKGTETGAFCGGRGWLWCLLFGGCCFLSRYTCTCLSKAYIRTYMRVYIHTHVYQKRIYIHMCVFIHAHVYQKRMYVHIHTLYVRTYAFDACIYIHMYTRTYIRISCPGTDSQKRIYVHTCALYVHTCAYMHTHVYVHVCVHIHTHEYTYIYTCLLSRHTFSRALYTVTFI